MPGNGGFMRTLWSMMENLENLCYSLYLPLFTSMLGEFIGNWWKSADIEIYMDEVFHIPQAQRYCNHEFEVWNDKITTFSGTYWWSFLLTGGGMLPCTTLVLRFTNVILGACIVPLVYHISSQLFPVPETNSLLFWPFLKLCRDLCLDFLFLIWPFIYPLDEIITFDSRSMRDKHNNIWSHISSCFNPFATCILVVLYPGVHFYIFMYYTDTLALVTVLALYSVFISCCRDGQKNVASLWEMLTLYALAGAAIMARQTNVVWVAFIGASCALDAYEAVEKDSVKNLSGFVLFLLRYRWQIGSRLLPLVIPCLHFVAFVIMNGGIVVGDKENHVVSVHPAMFFHAFFIAALMCNPITATKWTYNQIVSMPYWRKGQVAIAGALFAVVFFALYAGVVAHPFLLADNRHLTFYIWRYVLSWPLARLCLVPFYVAAFAFMYISLRERRTVLWILLFLVCAAATLVPVGLFEIRYFTPVVVMCLLNTPRLDSGRMNFVRYIAVLGANEVLLSVFRHQPFEWGDGTIARFML